MNTMKALLPFALIAALGMTAPSLADDTTGKETAGQFVDDTVITTRIKAALLSDSTLKGNEIKVETYKGEVQLSGFVTNPADAARAVSIASSISGVKTVKNDVHPKS